MFRFPSNGKVFPNFYRFSLLFKRTYVSIPFKREGLSKLDVYGQGADYQLVLNPVGRGTVEIYSKNKN